VEDALEGDFDPVGVMFEVVAEFLENLFEEVSIKDGLAFLFGDGEMRDCQNDAEAEAAESQAWLKFAVKYLDLDLDLERHSPYFISGISISDSRCSVGE
jgi:hypothetical protein